MKPTDAFLSNDRVSLSPIDAKDLSLLMAWRNSPALRSRTRQWRPLNMEDQARWYTSITNPHRTDHMFVVRALRDKSEDIRIGVVGLCGWNDGDAHAEVSFYIGDQDFLRQGYATSAVDLLCHWGFSRGLHRIWAEVYEFNVASRNLLERLSFKHEGTMVHHVWKDGAYHNSHILGRLNEN